MAYLSARVEEVGAPAVMKELLDNAADDQTSVFGVRYVDAARRADCLWGKFSSFRECLDHEAHGIILDFNEVNFVEPLTFRWLSDSNLSQGSRYAKRSWMVFER